jgi:hypothetical protein
MLLGDTIRMFSFMKKALLTDLRDEQAWAKFARMVTRLGAQPQFIEMFRSMLAVHRGIMQDLDIDNIQAICRQPSTLEDALSEVDDIINKQIVAGKLDAKKMDFFREWVDAFLFR